jgi:hypothetical protein
VIELPVDPAAPRLVGNDAGWHLVFLVEGEDGRLGEEVLSRGRADYYATILATLPGGLDGGNYTVAIEGMTNEDYKLLTPHRGRLAVKLYLYWRDTSSAVGRAASLAGLTDVVDRFGAGRDPGVRSLVAVLKVTVLSRKVGARRYEVVIEAREWVYDRLTKRLPESLSGKIGPLATAKAVAEALLGRGDFVKAHPDPDAQGSSSQEAPAEKKRTVEKGRTGIDHLLELGAAMENQAPGRNRFGLGMYLIRDGVLHLGPDRLDVAGDTKDLTPATGFIEVRPSGTVFTDAAFDPKTAAPDEKAPSRDLFEITMKGRPDLKPGDFVNIALPAEETSDGSPNPRGWAAGVRDMASAAFGSADVAAKPDRLVYVTGVSHRLSRTQGFVTTVYGVTTPDRDGTWYKHSADTKSEPHRELDRSPDARAADAVRRLVRGGADRRFLEVGQVRAVHAAGEDPPAQTEMIWRSLGIDDGDMYSATRVAFADDASAELTAMPYATPFAWGPCGLILPRYPGMRVLLEHRNGASSDPIDIGALWDWGRAPDAQPGDYWLILPAAIPKDQRASITGEDTPANPVGRATNDLIDADGNRVIEVGTLTIRVGADSLKDAGTRPAGEASTIHIEHAKGSKITIDQDGNVTVHSANDLTLSATGRMTLDASAIKVKVSSTMDVSKK